MKVAHKNDVTEVCIGEDAQGRLTVEVVSPDGTRKVLATAGCLGLDYMGWNSGAGNDYQTVQAVLDAHGYTVVRS